jgi:hypothetical protein
MRQRSTRSGRKYAAIPNAAMRDNSVSIEARGVLALLMTYADDWVFRRDKLMEITGLGRDKFQRVMSELQVAGYVDLETSRDEKGHLQGSQWVICDEAHNREPENPFVGGTTESLKNRQPAEPTAGESAPIRRPTSEEYQKGRKPLTPEGDCGDFFTANEIPEATTKPKAENKKTEDDFERFWRAFPPGRKTDKPKAAAAWVAIVAGRRKGIPKTEPSTIISGAERYAATNPDPQFVPMPTTWLNGARWDAIPEPEAPARNYGGHRRSAPWGEIVR